VSVEISFYLLTLYFLGSSVCLLFCSESSTNSSTYITRRSLSLLHFIFFIFTSCTSQRSSQRKRLRISSSPFIALPYLGSSISSLHYNPNVLLCFIFLQLPFLSSLPQVGARFHFALSSRYRDIHSFRLLIVTTSNVAYVPTQSHSASILLHFYSFEVSIYLSAFGRLYSPSLPPSASPYGLYQSL
jgi:hypothetical protein